MPLPLRGTLADFQRYVAELERERGFDDQTARDKCLLLGEEVGELFRAVRRAEGAIANRYGVDLEAAFRAKEAKNRERAWTSQGASGPSA
ncbi:MAG: pyrophosphohydrolase [Candidatus Bipolaricaulota bacterium]|nr:pyrophosphohydrolase [Candidatus Bipolaricaulota bacterium]